MWLSAGHRKNPFRSGSRGAPSEPSTEIWIQPVRNTPQASSGEVVPEKRNEGITWPMLFLSFPLRFLRLAHSLSCSTNFGFGVGKHQQKASVDSCRAVFRCPNNVINPPLFPPFTLVTQAANPAFLLQCQALSGISASRRIAWPKLLLLSPRRLYLVICAFSASPLKPLVLHSGSQLGVE
jgi:hypothetical protein